MVARWCFLLLGGLVFLPGVWAEDADAQEPQGPTLYGDGGGRIWEWKAGEKTLLTPEGMNLVLGGVGEEQLWGWSLERDRSRIFTLELPKKTEGGSEPKDAPKKIMEPALPVFDLGIYPIPDRVDRVGDRLLLVYGALSGHLRYEVWQAGERIAARAFDDGRLLNALALGPVDGWILAGRGPDGPWLEVSGRAIDAPEGWRGRLTVAAWFVEEKKEGADKKAPPPVALPLAAGWGAPGTTTPRPLFWGPDGWTQPAEGEPQTDSVATAPGVYPVLGAAGKEGGLILAGWQSDSTGTLRPWFWDGQAADVPGGAADGQPQAFSVGGKGGAFLVVRHQASPWFTLENGKESVTIEGLGAEDRVLAVANSSP